MYRAVIGCLVIALVVIAGFIVYGISWNSEQEAKEVALPTPVASSQASTHSSSSSVAVPSSVSSAQSSIVQPSPTSSSVVAETTAPPAIQLVSQSPPTHLTISAPPGFTVNAKIGEMDYNDDLAAPSCTGNLDPECPEKAYWIHDRLGVAPSSSCSEDPNRNDSTYIMGHSWTQDPRVFDVLSDYAMKHYDPAVSLMGSTDREGSKLDDVETHLVPSLHGSVVTLETGTGTITYEITKVYIVRKGDVGRTDEFRKGRGCQLIIDTCGIDLSERVDTDFAVILFADIRGAVPR